MPYLPKSQFIDILSPALRNSAVAPVDPLQDEPGPLEDVYTRQLARRMHGLPPADPSADHQLDDEELARSARS